MKEWSGIVIAIALLGLMRAKCVVGYPSTTTSAYRYKDHDGRRRQTTPSCFNTNKNKWGTTRKSKVYMLLNLDASTAAAYAFVLTSPLLAVNPPEEIEDVITALASVFSGNPAVEEEVLLDMAHVVLDFATSSGPDIPPIMPLLPVIGRLLIIGADYLPDHSMNFEEMIFQALMLGIASNRFFHSLRTTMSIRSVQTTFQDRRVYVRTFSQVGMTWLQYKTMIAAVVIDWINIDGGEIISSEESPPNCARQECFFIVHKGSATVLCQGQVLEQAISPSLLGEMRFARQLDGHEESTNDYDDLPRMTITAGDEGATLLRIQSSKLLELMQKDKKLANSIRSLIVKGMQDKLVALASIGNCSSLY
jgi:hypothetical protein